MTVTRTIIPLGPPVIVPVPISAPVEPMMVVVASVTAPDSGKLEDGRVEQAHSAKADKARVVRIGIKKSPN